MVLEGDQVAFLQWLPAALLFFLQAALVLAAVVLVGGFLIAAFRYGPLAGGDAVYRMLRTGLIDAISISPRRVLALARLAVQESLRRRVLVGFGVFLIILLFAGWFLDTKTNDPATLYLSFVLTATTYLVLLMALFLSTFSLPADIKNHTIDTVVTKPVRPGEIVLGRILGFAAIGTILLVVMGAVSYLFVIRVLNHTHEVEIASLRPVTGKPGAQAGRTSLVENHRHQVTIFPDGKGETDTVNGHFHYVNSRTQGDETVYELSSPQDMLTARVPTYATQLRFKDRNGTGAAKGINVGNEWKYRSFIEGGSLAAAIWTFNGISADQFPKKLPIEMTIRVFRSWKGNIEKGIRGSLVLRNPRTGLTSKTISFYAKEFYTDHLDIDRTLVDHEGNPIDLYNDLVANGELEIQLQCVDDSQYFGVAPADLYIRARDASFGVNFIKSYLGIWVQMLLVTSFGVMFSTFLSGPVAMMATLASLVLGFFAKFVFEVAQGTIQGGGPVESMVRIIKQQNVISQLDPGLTKTVVQSIDAVFMLLMESITSLLPDFRKFSDVEYVAHGFDIPPDILGVQLVSALGYVAAVFVIGYFFLRTREVAR